MSRRDIGGEGGEDREHVGAAREQFVVGFAGAARRSGGPAARFDCGERRGERLEDAHRLATGSGGDREHVGAPRRERFAPHLERAAGVVFERVGDAANQIRDHHRATQFGRQRGDAERERARDARQHGYAKRLGGGDVHGGREALPFARSRRKHDLIWCDVYRVSCGRA